MQSSSPAPVFFVGMFVLLYRLKRKIPRIDRSESLSAGFVFGIPAGIIFYYSNDYGVASTVSIFVILVIAVLAEKSKPAAKTRKLLIFMVFMAAAFIAFGVIISRGHFGSYLAATFGAGGGQGWYYNGSKSYYIWDIDISFWACVQAIVVLLYLIILIKKGFSVDNLARYGIPMFFNMAAYAAENEYKLLSGEVLHEVSYTILYLTLCAECISFLTTAAAQKGAYRIAKTVLPCGLALTGIAWSISSYVPLKKTVNISGRGTYVENLGYFDDDELAKSIVSTDEFLGDEDTVFSTYASGIDMLLFRSEHAYDAIFHNRYEGFNRL